jgi:hypothetical protein
LFVSGYSTDMVDSANACALPPCYRSAVVEVWMLVDGEEAVMATCELHAQWLQGYVEEDAGVRVLDVVPEDAEGT